MQPVADTAGPAIAPTAPAVGRVLTAPAKCAVFLLGVCALLNIYSTQPLLPVLSRDLHVPLGQSTWTISATTLGVAVMAPLAGSASDRLGRRRVILAAIGASLVTTLALATAWSFTALLVLRLAQGLLIPFVFAVAVAYLAEEYDGARAQAANALYVSGTAFGGFLGRFLAGVAAAHAGWRASFLPLAAVLLVTLLAAWRWLPAERHFERSRSLLAGLHGIGGHLGNPRLLGTCLVGAALLFLQVGAFTYAGLRLEGPPFRLSTLQSGAVFAVFLIAVVATPLAGRLITRFGRLRAFAVAGLVSLIGLGLTLIPTTPTVVAGLAASCTGVFAGQACAIGYAATAGRAARSGAVGLYLAGYYAGGSVGAVAPAPVYAAGGWTACAALLAAVTGLAIVIARLSWSTTTDRRRPVEESR